MRFFVQLAFLLIGLSLVAQEKYTVISVKGNITTEKGKAVVKGMKIKFDEKLQFSSINDAIAGIAVNPEE